MSAIVVSSCALIFLLVLVGIISVSVYNSLVTKRNNIDNAFGAIDAQLKLRYDLIPNLVDAVKKYMQYEKSTLEKITELRTQALAENLKNEQKNEINNKLSAALNNLIVAVENYPVLKANQNVIYLLKSLSNVESEIAAARRAYNAAITDYNNSVGAFPSNIIAAFFSFKTMRVLEITEAERKNIQVGGLFG